MKMRNSQVLLLLIQIFLVKYCLATDGGCWNAAASPPGAAASVTGATICETNLANGVTVETTSCSASANSICCSILTGTNNYCNRITSCYDPQRSNSTSSVTKTCDEDNDWACAIDIYNGEGLCIGKGSSSARIDALVSDDYIFYNRPNAQVTCFDPSNYNNINNGAVSCQPYQWSCQTDLLTGIGTCASNPNTKPSTSTMFYCTGKNTKGDNCNNWAANSWQCSNPKDNTYVNCMSYEWFCSTQISTGLGQCRSTPNLVTTSAQYVCGTGDKCNSWLDKTCWNPLNDTIAPTCQNYHWQCKTDLTTGYGSCARDGTTYTNAYYCSGFSNCNNFGPITNSPYPGVGWTCWDPSNSKSVACTSSQWQCQTNTVTGVGGCVGVANLFAKTCASQSNCNVISSCYDSRIRSTVSCPAPFATKACQSTVYGLWDKKAVTGCSTTCSTTSTNNILLNSGTTSCCYFNDCNAFASYNKGLWNYNDNDAQSQFYNGNSNGNQLKASFKCLLTTTLFLILMVVSF